MANDNLLKEERSMSDATNRFFEARVAVMGFKCRTMQLQGELDELVCNSYSLCLQIITICFQNFLL